ncbi:MAG: hypothetical protein A3G24_09140 [Betaproteobacteria bacterium RIFCSPLOWO2_12_FULL_62_13]|nr:MAG: hypothetical protein A3G24_09140 [Betaproteobacteria bacterium RIFCSPLOWO2_12_FULL_62_13]
MHFRVRKNVVQLIRTTYDKSRKKGNNAIIGTVRLAKPELSAELRRELKAEEIAAFDAWMKTQRHTDALREELAALTLAETVARAERWFEREGDSVAARAAVAEVVLQWQTLRRLLARKGLLD